MGVMKSSIVDYLDLEETLFYMLSKPVGFDLLVMTNEKGLTGTVVLGEFEVGNTDYSSRQTEEAVYAVKDLTEFLGWELQLAGVRVSYNGYGMFSISKMYEGELVKVSMSAKSIVMHSMGFKSRRYKTLNTCKRDLRGLVKLS